MSAIFGYSFRQYAFGLEFHTVWVHVHHNVHALKGETTHDDFEKQNM